MKYNDLILNIFLIMSSSLNSLLVFNRVSRLSRMSHFVTCFQLQTSLYTVDQEWEYLEVVNKSKFLVRLTRIEDMDTAMLYLNRIRDSKVC